MSELPTGLDLMTVAEVAKECQVSEQTVRNWLQAGKLPEVRAGVRRVRIRRDDLDAFLGIRPAPSAETDQVDDVWRSFAVALTQAAADTAAGDVRRLARSLRKLAAAADRLAGALGESGT